MARSSVTARIKITKNGKLMRRKTALGHFRANKSSGKIREKRSPEKISKSDHKNIIHFLKGSRRRSQ